MHFNSVIASIWDSEIILGRIVNFLDYAGIFDLIAGVIFFIIWRRNKESADRKLGLLAILTTVLAGILWVGDAKCAHRLSELQQQALGSQLASTSNDLSQAKIAESNAIAAARNATNVVNSAAVAVIQHLDRRMTAEQRNQLASILSQFPKGRVAFNVSPVVSDAQPLANDIANAFTKAGFAIVGVDGNMEMPTFNWIWVGTFGETNSPIDKAIADALSSMGFACRQSAGSHFYPGVTYIDVGKK